LLEFGKDLGKGKASLRANVQEVAENFLLGEGTPYPFLNLGRKIGKNFLELLALLLRKSGFAVL
jgi:hypothetical protein